MAAPAEVTTKDLTGKYVMNKALSDNSDAILQLQGINWVTRKAISIATVTLHVNHKPGANPDTGADVITIIQVLTGGLKGSTETRNLDFQARGHTDHVFGEVEGRSQSLPDLASLDTKILSRNKSGEIDPLDLKILKGETLADGTTPSKFLDSPQWIQSYAENAKAGWTAEQIWGFEEVDGKRRYTRRVVVRKKDSGDAIRARLVYDYVGKVELTE